MSNSKQTDEAQHSVDILRALLNTQKYPITLSVLLKEYREMEGRNLPFKNFGFKSAEAFIRSSGEFLLINDRGETHVSARPNKDSAHISEMIARQKTDKKRSRRSSGFASNYRVPAKIDQSWNKSSYSTINQNRGYDRSKRNGGTYQRLGDSNNNTSSSNNRNISNYTSPKSSNDYQNWRSPLPQPQPLMANPVPKPDLRDRLTSTKQAQQNLDQQKQQQQKSPKQNNTDTKSNEIKKQNDTQKQQSKNSQSNDSATSKHQQQQKLLVAQSKPNGALSSVANRLENLRNVKNLIPNAAVVRSSGTSLADRLKVNKSSGFDLNPAAQEFTKPDKVTLTNCNGNMNGKHDSFDSFLRSANNRSNGNMPGKHNSFDSFLRSANNRKSEKSSPTKDKPIKILSPTEKYQFDPKLNSIVSLVNYCMARGLPQPKFELKQTRFTHNQHVCSVVINDNQYTTYPKYFNDPEIAKAACAAIAIEEIKEIEAQIVSYPMCTDSDSELTYKMYDELKTNHSCGIFLKMFPKLFESKFQQSLPDHWISLIQKSKSFTLEMTVDNQNTIVVANSCFVELNSPVARKDELIIDPLILPWDSKYWNLFITHCASTVEIWARIVDKEYSQQLDSLLNDIDMTMLTDKTRPGSLTTGHMYLVCISECWHRVRLERMDKATGKCLCFFIDFGDDDWIAMDQLFICDKKFLKLPPQAVPFSLFGLEDFAENPVANRHLNEMLLNKTLIAQIFTKKEAYEAKNLPSSSSSFGSSESINDIVKIQAVLYDTSSHVDVVLNPLLINKICDDTPATELKQSGPTNVNITHINDDGDIFLQVLGSGLQYVQKLISQLVESKFQQDQYRVSPLDIKPSNLYLIHDADENQWYRAALVGIHDPNANEFEMFYVDHGVVKMVSVSKIFRLESLSAALSRYPRQGLRAKMHNLPPLNEFVMNRLKDLLPSNTVAIVKLAFNKVDTSKSSPTIIPQIVVFIRVDRNQSLCNVNDAIRMEYELLSNDYPLDIYKSLSRNDSNSSTCSSPTSPQLKFNSDVSSQFSRSLAVRSPITVPTTPTKGSLPKLNLSMSLPAKGELFNVLVTLASNPFNFFVRPYDDFLEYQNMMTELQNYCQDNDEFIPDDMVETGEAYAALLNDGFYYRCIIEIILPNQMCVVYFCDCGDRNTVDISKLRTLPPQCRQLAAQAIQAKLHGVKPITGEWSLEDSIRFNELTVGQKFASVVENISIDDFNPNKTTQVLELTMIDVLTSKDIFIHELLIEENRAVLS